MMDRSFNLNNSIQKQCRGDSALSGSVLKGTVCLLEAGLIKMRGVHTVFRKILVSPVSTSVKFHSPQLRIWNSDGNYFRYLKPEARYSDSIMG